MSLETGKIDFFFLETLKEEEEEEEKNVKSHAYCDLKHTVIWGSLDDVQFTAQYLFIKFMLKRNNILKGWSLRCWRCY